MKLRNPQRECCPSPFSDVSSSINVQAMLYLVTHEGLGEHLGSLGKERVISQYVRFAENDKSEGTRLAWTLNLYLFNQVFL